MALSFPTDDRLVRTGSGRAQARYRWIWRWHFYAGLCCTPWLLWLAVTGAIYLFAPQIDTWQARPYDHVPADAAQRAPSEQVAAALASLPGTRLNAYQLPASPAAATQVLVGRGEELYRAYVDPVHAQVVHALPDDQRLSRLVFHLHGELLLGDTGSVLVELMACWAIVLLLSGLYLWWPRDRRLAGVIYPRLHRRGRPFWRDLHAVVGCWIALLALFLLVSGLPWTYVWGSTLEAARQGWSGQPMKADWNSGRGSELRHRLASNAPPSATMGRHAAHRSMAAATEDVSYAALDRLVPLVRAMYLPPPVLIAPPSARSPQWTARSDTPNRPLRVRLDLDPEHGRVLGRQAFSQQAWLDRVIDYGIAAHEGQLFAPLNQALGLATAVGLITLVISGWLMWWRRRPAGSLGAPPRRDGERAPVLPIAALVVLGLCLPLLGASAIAVWLVERQVFRRIPSARRFLNLGA